MTTPPDPGPKQPHGLGSLFESDLAVYIIVALALGVFIVVCCV